MNKIFTFLLSMLVCAFTFAQKPTAAIDKATTAPQIDGVIDELWASVPKNNIDKAYLTDVPTLGDLGSTYWKALWDDNGIYILINVNDDVFAPGYKYAAADNWRYDMIEVYFDANFTKNDNKGVNDGAGHYQVAFNFAANNINGELGTDGSGVKYAFKAGEGPYVAEYFVPFSKLKDSDGNIVDKSGEIGFDMYVIDSDSDQPERKRATWANTGAIAESYDVMDDCGIITLNGAEANVQVESITVSGPTEITEDNDTIRLVASVLPENATAKTVNWSVVNGTGKAHINATGLLTAVSDGTVTVVATAADGSFVTGSLDVNISGQVTNKAELSVLLGGTFDTDGPIAAPWSKGGGVGSGSIIDGAVYAEVGTGGNQSAFQLTQNGFVVEPDIPYVLIFDAWTDEDVASRVVVCDFEDPSNSWERYGDSPDGLSGKSEWNDAVTNEQKTYTHTVTFTRIKPTTAHNFIFQLGNEESNVYIDNVFLFTEEDYNKILSGVKNVAQNAIKLYPNPVVGELNISQAGVNAKICIYNALGQKVMEQLSGGINAKVNVSSLTKGVYFVKVNDGESLRFIK
ncbi:MAG TPA: sugar-binding protein [Prolixibacteraceae bacterium]|nr:sugar-binding protein [Prolixibacteraceae bacterium]